MDTPFVYNKYVTGRNFVGHRLETNALANMLSAGDNVVLYAPPRSGRTSLIQQTILSLRSQGRNFALSEIDLLRTRTIDAFLIQYGTCAIRAFASTPGEYSDIVGRLLEGTHFVFDQTQYAQADEIISLNWDIDDNDIISMLRLPYRLAAENGRQLYVIINEFQNINHTEDGNKIYRLFEKVMKEVRERGDKTYCAFVFSGSQVNAMKEVFEHQRFFYRMVETLPFGIPEDKDIIDHIMRGFLSSGKVIDRDLLMGVCRLFRGNMWYINHFISICDSLSKGYIMEPILVEALDKIISIHEPRFVAWMNDLTTFQVSLLKAILDGHKKFSSSEVIEEYGLHSSANVRRLKDALCKKELITFNDKDEPSILDPLFEYWVRRTYFMMEDAR